MTTTVSEGQFEKLVSCQCRPMFDSLTVLNSILVTRSFNLPNSLLAMTADNLTATAVIQATEGKVDAASQTPRKRAPRPPRPNYKHIHRFPLPLTVHPLPPLIPHNPLSVVSIVLSYLTYYISPPQHEVFTAYFDSSTSSVHVTDPRTMRALWEMGFFGKGTLSRSEPTWLEREKKRRGLLGVDTSEEATRKRRVERREWKLERARKEKEAIAEQLKAEAARAEKEKHEETSHSADTTGSPTANGGLGDSSKSLTETQATGSGEASTLPPQEHYTTKGTHKSVRFSPVVEAHTASRPYSEAHENSVNDEEHLQLSNEEAFFLVYGLGALQVHDGPKGAIMSASSLLPQFRRHSYFPPLASNMPYEPDDPFIISYAAYHHFRSLGWVVRSGVKFGVDYLLYNRGPVFSHAEFAVVLLPSYAHPYWAETEGGRERVAKKWNRSWWWLHCVNRVQAQVKKSLILCYVEVPAPSADPEDDIGALLQGYKVRELNIKRWVPNRSRD